MHCNCKLADLNMIFTCLIGGSATPVTLLTNVILLQLEDTQTIMADLDCASSFFASVIQGILHDLVGLLLQQLLQGYAHPPCSIPTFSGLCTSASLGFYKSLAAFERACAPPLQQNQLLRVLTIGF